MKAPSPEEVTEILFAWSNSNKEALNQLMPLVYRELHTLARRHTGSENPGHTPQSTALVNHRAAIIAATFRTPK